MWVKVHSIQWAALRDIGMVESVARGEWVYMVRGAALWRFADQGAA